MRGIDAINKRYFRWIRDNIYKSDFRKSTYDSLLSYLHDTPFRFSSSTMDGNRYEDGISLRYRFGIKKGYSDSIIAANLDNRNCSILEMMVALSIRIENIMADSEHEDRTSDWFWIMIYNLGLAAFDDYNFDEETVSLIVQRFLDRNYADDGSGGLFVIPGSIQMNKLDIWYQMHEFLKAYKKGDIII